MKVHIGEFDAESHWADEMDAKLPNYSQNSSRFLVDAMDELLYGFVESDDVLITKKQFDVDLKKYLENLGIRFSTFTKKEFKHGLESLIKRFWELEPYAITDYVLDTYDIYPNVGKLPSIETIRRVNSKSFSTNLSDMIKCNPHKSYIVHSVNEMEEIMGRFHNSPIIIKEYYGVSGRGSLVLNNSASKSSILRYLKRLSQVGKNINFIIEQYLDKVIDFSTHIHISPTGEISVLAVRMMANSSLAYQGSYRMNNVLIKELSEKGYFETIDRIGQYLFQEGYWGPVGIDSMILSSDRIVPLVEINARKSMGLLHYSLEKKLQLDESWLTFYNLGMPSYVGIRQIIDALHNRGLLYEKERTGILPLSGNTLKLDEQKELGRFHKGRLYFLIITEEKNKLQMLHEFRKILGELNIVIYQ